MQNVAQPLTVQKLKVQRSNLLIVSIFTLATFAVAPYAIAESAGSNVIYKSTDKTGHTTYSEKPPATPASKAKTVELNIDPNQNVLPSEIPRIPASPSHNPSVNGSTNSVADAEAALEAAEQALAAGLETQPGDFTGKSGGGVGPSMQRRERLNQLQADVNRARENLEQVRSGRN